MVAQARKVSWWDNARFLLMVSVPAFLRGVVAPTPQFSWLLSGKNAGEAAMRLLATLRKKYDSDHLWLWFPFGRTLLVLDPASIELVLRSDKNQADPPIKKTPLSKFVPEGVIISSGDEWRERRGFNERVLEFGQLHSQAETFKRIVDREVDQMAAAGAKTLCWNDFQELGTRIAHQVILGLGHIEPELAAQLARMVSLANWSIPSRKRVAFYRELERKLSDHRAAVKHTQTMGQAAHEAAASECLMHASARLLESGEATASTHVPCQMAFWFFVLKDAVELHVARTLALIAAHPDVQEKVQREFTNASILTARGVDNLHYLEACISEQLRLWSPVPLLVRRVVDELQLRDEINLKSGQQILMHAGFYHRDSSVFGERTDRFSPDAADGDFPPVYVFSGHRQSCAGQFLARFILKATLAALLSRLRFELVSPQVDVNRIPYLYNHFNLKLRVVSRA